MVKFQQAMAKRQDDPGRVRDFPKLTIQINPQRKALLTALASTLSTSERIIVEEALKKLYDDLEPAQRAAIDRRIGGSPATERMPSIAVPEHLLPAVERFIQMATNPASTSEQSIITLFENIGKVPTTRKPK